MEGMNRETFNKRYAYCITEQKHRNCGNCIHRGGYIIYGHLKPDECALITRCGARDISIDSHRGLCDLWQEKKGE
jgi:hypothetical protein